MNIKQALVAMFLGVCFMQTPIFAAINLADSKKLKKALQPANVNVNEIDQVVSKYSQAEIQQWLAGPSGRSVAPKWQQYLQATGKAVATGQASKTAEEERKRKEEEERKRREAAAKKPAAQAQKALDEADLYTLVNLMRGSDSQEVIDHVKTKISSVADLLNRQFASNGKSAFYWANVLIDLLGGLNYIGKIEKKIKDEEFIQQYYFKVASEQNELDVYADKPENEGTFAGLRETLKEPDLVDLQNALTNFIQEKLNNLNVGQNKKILRNFIGDVPSQETKQFLINIDQQKANEFLGVKTSQPQPTGKQSSTQVMQLNTTATKLAKEITEKLSKSSLAQNERDIIAVQWGFTDFAEMERTWGS